jgi:hypothetical protein
MSKEFIKERIGQSDLAVAKRQQEQINYFTQSKVQEEVSQDYINQWANRKYRTNDYFLTWVKNVFRTPNFLTFYKYLRHPLPSAKLINDEVIPMLKRVYFAEDSYFHYIINDEMVEKPQELDCENFENRLFNAYLFNYNDIIVHDLEDVNKPYREIVSIENVIAIKSKNNRIKKIAYTASIDIDGQEVLGYAYIDDERYAFYDTKVENEILNIPHDLGYCPATYITNEPFSLKSDVVRKSIFSYVREEFEEYVFLKTLRKMSEPNGAIPITVKLKGGANKDKSGVDQKKDLDQYPLAANTIGNQQAQTGSEVSPSDSVLQTGTIVDMPAIKKNDGSIDMEAVQSFLKMYYIPVECLKFIDDRIKDIERSIIANALGDQNQSNDAAKNEDQVFYSMNNKQDKLRSLSMALSWVRNISDSTMLDLKYGPENVKVDLFYGSDFFLDTEAELYDRFKNAPNQIERKNVLKRLGQTRYRFNPTRAKREKLLYTLLPYSSDKDFEIAIQNNLVDDSTKKLQLQFDHYIALFEAQYGDILQFYVTLEAEDSQKLVLIKNLLTNLISNNE